MTLNYRTFSENHHRRERQMKKVFSLSFFLSISIIVFFMLSGTISQGMVLATQTSTLTFSKDDVDPYYYSQTIRVDLWEGEVDENDDQFRVNIDLVSLSGLNQIWFKVELWELVSGKNFLGFDAFFENTTPGSLLETFNWYELVGVDKSSKQKMSIMVGIDDDERWNADVELEVTVLASWVSVGWKEDPQGRSAPTEGGDLIPGWEAIPVFLTIGTICIWRRLLKVKS